MITNNKKHKEIKIHKLNSQYFNNAKKYNTNKSTNEIALIKQNISPIKRRKRNSIRSSIIDNFLHIEEKSVSGKFRNAIKIPNNIGSANHVNKIDFKDIINDIKQEIKSTQYKVAVQSNISLISMYFRLGKILSDNYKYGNKFIDEVSKDLKIEFPNSTGFSVRNLKYMKNFTLNIKMMNLCNSLLHKFHGDTILFLWKKLKIKK